MSHSQRLLWSNSLTLFSLGLIFPAPLIAQVSAPISDNTLSTQVNQLDGSNFTIEGGKVSGSNLFHSFEAFSIPTNGSVTFNNGANIQTIINRVTGESSTRIDGLLRTAQPADVFLLNPNGIRFGENARLDIGGSFFATTGESLRFADGTEFSADSSATPPLLTMTAPVGVQYGASPGAITVAGSGSNLQLDFNTFAIDRSNRNPGLSVGMGETLVLAGGEINLTGGNLTAEDGRIELASVGANELLEIGEDWRLNPESVERFGNISLSETASADVSGVGGGNLRVIGANLTLQEGSALLSNTEGDLPGGEMTLDLTEAMTLSGVRVDNEGNPLFPSRIFAEVSPGATGQGGNVTINTRGLNLSEGAQIAAQTFGLGDAGVLEVNADQILSLGGTRLGPTGLFAITANLGNAGELKINTGYLGIGGGSQLSTSSFSPSNAGQVSIVADTVEVVGGAQDLGASSILSRGETPAYQGSGGEINLTADNLVVADGARIQTGSDGGGQGGQLQVNATDIQLVGTSPSGSAGGLFSFVAPSDSPFLPQLATANGGDIIVNTQTLEITDGGQIATSTAGSGDGGDLKISAERVELSGTGSIAASGLFASSLSPINPSNGQVSPQAGAGGNITVNSNQVLVRDGATISASNFPSSSNNPDVAPGEGSAGNVTVTGNLIELDDRALITASTASGGRGNVTLSANDLLQLNRNSNIAANAQGTEPGGNIAIDAPFLIGQNNSDITANAVNARGGRVNITTNAIFGLQVREQQTDLSDITASSELGAEFQGIITINSPEVDPSEGLVELPDTPVDVTNLIAQGCAATEGNVFVVTGRGGLPEAPNQTLRGAAVWQDLRPLGNETVAQAPPEVTPPEQAIEAQGWVSDANGEIWLVAQTPNPSLESASKQVIDCRTLNSQENVR
ncbi:MAG: filamentous hemagglutinin N-terminal domain-containing protein [Cyanobacteria bacterium]|nr:filamentous hemagglutinin N-terminal domain-containing protein [Cyanobacteria bacterium GSL.Bin1]